MSTKKHTPGLKKSTLLTVADEEQRLRDDIYRPDKEKLQLFTQMLRVNNLFKKAKISHK